MDLPEGASREELAAYLDEACGDDAELRGRVEALLAAGKEAGEDFLATQQVAEGSGVPPTPAIEREGSVVGNYKLLQAIGEGGFGVVYMAEQQKPVKRRVAFKLIKPGMDSKQVVARFEAERQALALMDHPNIAKVLDAGETASGRPYFVMELVKGVPITEFCDEHKLSTGERLELFVDVCRAVQHAHQKGVIHRDLKPSNVMVTLHDDKAVVKVIDFGVAKATQGELTEKTLFTKFEQFIGTPAYMSPEQAQLSGLDIDTRSDIYALGVLLYELLTGRTPFDQKELLSAGYDEMRRVIREDDPPKPSTRMGTLVEAELTDLADQRRSEPRKLRALLRGEPDWIVMKALEKDRKRRYETANALAMDVRRYLADEPVDAGPPGVGYRVGKLVRRHRATVLTAGAMAFLLVAGAAVSAWQWRRASSNEKVAVESGVRAMEAASVAEQTAEELKDTLVRSHFAAANEALESGKSGESLAYLAQAMRTDPDFWPAAFQTMQVLSDQAFLHSAPHSITGGAPFRRVIASPTEEIIVTESTDRRGEVWDAASGQKLAALRLGTEDVGRIQGVQFSPDGSLVFAALIDRGGDIVGFDPHSGRAITPPIDVEGIAKPWFRVGSNDDAGPLVLVEHGDPSSIQVFCWTGVNWKAGPRLNMGGGVASVVRQSERPTSLEARRQQFYLEPEGTAFLETARYSYRPVFGFSPDGLLIYAHFANGTTGAWDAMTGIPKIEPIQNGNFNSVVRISPSSGQIVIVAREERSVLWGALDQSGSPPIRKDLTFVPKKFAFAEDGTKLTVAGWTQDGALNRFHVRVFDLETGNQVSQIDEDGFSMQWALPAPFPDGRADWWAQDRFVADPWLVGAAFDDGRRLKVWDPDSGMILCEFDTAENPVEAFTFLRDGRRLLTQHRDYSVRLWDVYEGVPITLPMAHGWRPYIAIPGVDQTKVVTYDPSVRRITIWDARDGKPLIQPISHSQKGNWRDHLTLPGTGRFVHVTREEHGGELGIWQPGFGAPPMLDSLMPTEAPVNHVVFNPRGDLLLGCISTAIDRPGYVRIWDASTMEMVDEIVHPAGVVYAEFSPTENKIVSVCLDGGVRLWDRDAGRFSVEHWQERVLRSSGHAKLHAQNSLASYMGHKQGQARAHFSPDGRTVAMHSTRGRISTWDVGSGATHFESDDWRGPMGLSNLAFSPDGRKLTLCSQHRIPVLDTFTGEQIFPALRLDSLAEDARFSADGRYLFGSQWPGQARQWDATSGELKHVLLTGTRTPWEGFTHFMIHPDPNSFLVANQTNWGPDSTAGFVNVWNCETGKLAMNPLWIGGQSEDHLLDFSPDGRLLGGATKNGEVVIWELKLGKRMLHRPATGEPMYSTDFSRDSTMLAVSSSRGVSVIHLPSAGGSAPHWLPDLGEAVGGKRLLPSGRIEPTAKGAFASVTKEIDVAQTEKVDAHWVRWLVDDRESRAVSPFSTRGLLDYASHLSRAGDLEDQMRAIQLCPGRGEFYARAAYLYAVDPRRDEFRAHIRNRWDATIQYYSSKAVELAPDSGEVWALRAAAFQRIGYSSAADSALVRAMVIAANSPTVWYVQALQQQESGEHEAAYSSFVKAITLLPGSSFGKAKADEPFYPALLAELRSFGSWASSARALALVGQAKIGEGRLSEARWLCRRAGELAADQDEVVVWAAHLALDPRPENYEEAAKILDRRIADYRDGGITPTETADLEKLVMLFDQGGRVDQGRKWRIELAQLHQVDGTSITLNDMAVEAAAMGDWETARASLEQVLGGGIEEMRGAGVEWMKLASVYLLLGDAEAHQALVRKMVERYSGSGQAASLERTAKSYFAAPIDPASPLSKKVQELAHRSVEIADGYHEWMALCAGMAEYRMGNLVEAKRLLEEARDSPQNECAALALPYIAMALHQGGEKTAALGLLRLAEDAIAPFLAEIDSAEGPSVWHDRAFAILALKEARAMILDSNPADP